MLYKLIKNYVFSDNDQDLYDEEAEPIFESEEINEDDEYYINTDHIIDVTKIYVEKVSKIRRERKELYNILLTTEFNILVQQEDFDNIIAIINKR